ncbi:MAG TPA: DUF2007 domain-containing protein [Gemmataceae bacterium]|jgi:hypothetical protein|nr:DUF2007 domain-containing protein [Gemmataceae bacterium]
MSMEHEDNIVRLATASNPFQAHVWEQALKREGIRCKVVGDYLDAGIGDVPGVRAEVWVHRDDLERARAVVKDGEEAFGGEAPEEETGEPPAP